MQHAVSGNNSSRSISCALPAPLGNTGVMYFFQFSEAILTFSAVVRAWTKAIGNRLSVMKRSDTIEHVIALFLTHLQPFTFVAPDQIKVVIWIRIIITFQASIVVSGVIRFRVGFRDVNKGKWRLFIMYLNALLDFIVRLDIGWPYWIWVELDWKLMTINDKQNCIKSLVIVTLTYCAI